MLSIERHKYICDSLNKNGTVSISELSKNLKVSAETIRRDLLSLESAGKLRRIHGGAMRPESIRKFASLKESLNQCETEKTAVAVTAANLISDGDIIALDSGSTAIKLCEEIVKSRKKITVITNSMDNFNILRNEESINLILIGGYFNSDENLFYGHVAQEMLKNYHVMKSFIFPDAISLKSGICGYGGYIAEIQRLLIDIADKVIVLANSEKLEKNSFEKISDMKKGFIYVTDSSVADVIKEEYRKNEINLIIGEEK